MKRRRVGASRGMAAAILAPPDTSSIPPLLHGMVPFIVSHDSTVRSCDPNFPRFLGENVGGESNTGRQTSSRGQYRQGSSSRVGQKGKSTTAHSREPTSSPPLRAADTVTNPCLPTASSAHTNSLAVDSGQSSPSSPRSFSPTSVASKSVSKCTLVVSNVPIEVSSEGLRAYFLVYREVFLVMNHSKIKKEDAINATRHLNHKALLKSHPGRKLSIHQL